MRRHRLCAQPSAREGLRHPPCRGVRGLISEKQEGPFVKLNRDRIFTGHHTEPRPLSLLCGCGWQDLEGGPWEGPS